jgi:hypothetical protein
VATVNLNHIYKIIYSKKQSVSLLLLYV